MVITAKDLRELADEGPVDAIPLDDLLGLIDPDDYEEAGRLLTARYNSWQDYLSMPDPE